MENLQKKDFIEINFTGRIKGGDIFDSNIKEDLMKIPNASQEQAKPLIFPLGEGMFLKGIEDFLIGKKIRKYEIELTPEKAFGQRQQFLVQVMPIKVFAQQEVIPHQGMIFNFDGRIGKILSVSGGRVIVDFNNPLAGKTVIYDITIIKKIDDLNEKIRSFLEFLFKKEFKFEIKEGKIVLEVEKKMKQFVELFKDKFKEVFGLNLEIKEIAEKQETKNQ